MIIGIFYKDFIDCRIGVFFFRRVIGNLILFCKIYIYKILIRKFR